MNITGCRLSRRTGVAVRPSTSKEIGGDVMTFVDDDLTVASQQLAASTIGCHRLQHRDVDLACRFRLAAADRADPLRIEPEK